MRQVRALALSRRNRSVDKPNEDAYALRWPDDGAVLVVADGVTRSRLPDGSYPLPSGAAIAARLVAEALADALSAPGGRLDMAAAFAAANRAVDLANRRNGVWSRLDFGVHDLWGAVATAVVVQDGTALWGHVGDGVLLHLPKAGGIVVPTPDQVVAAMHFVEQLPQDDVAAAGGPHCYARRLLRNHPEAAVSYGVLTGEGAAEQYVVTGKFAVLPGDTLVLCTDGLGSLRADAWEGLKSGLRGTLDGAALERLLDGVEAADECLGVRSDDKTVIVGVVGA